MKVGLKRAAGTSVGALFSLLLAVAHPAPALAQEAPSDEAAVEQRRNEAKSKYQAGAAAYEHRRFKDAVELFLAADRLAPSAPLSFNIARAYEKLGDDTSALRWYRDYLRRNPTAQNAESVRELVGKLAAALAKKGVQQLTVLSTPAGATVNVDEQPVGVTPWTGELAPGKHHVLLSYRGYADAERDVELGAAEPSDVSIRMDAASAAPATPAPAPAPVLTPAPDAPPAGAPIVPPPNSEPHRSSLGVWPWVTLGAGVATLGGSLAFELLRRSDEDDAKHESTQLGFQSAVDTMESRKTLSRVLLGVGGALAVTGGVLIWVDARGKAPNRQLGFACVPGACALRAGSRF